MSSKTERLWKHLCTLIHASMTSLFLSLKYSCDYRYKGSWDWASGQPYSRRDAAEVRFKNAVCSFTAPMPMINFEDGIASSLFCKSVTPSGHKKGCLMMTLLGFRPQLSCACIYYTFFFYFSNAFNRVDHFLSKNAVLIICFIVFAGAGPTSRINPLRSKSRTSLPDPLVTRTFQAPYLGLVPDAISRET